VAVGLAVCSAVGEDIGLAVGSAVGVTVELAVGSVVGVAIGLGVCSGCRARGGCRASNELSSGSGSISLNIIGNNLDNFYCESWCDYFSSNQVAHQKKNFEFVQLVVQYS
jgi:hypothetical protein